MLEGGFIVIHRKIINWEWYKEPNTLCVFIHLLLTANYEERRFMGQTIKRGQRVASYRTLAEETGLSVRNVRTAINHLKLTHEVTSYSTSKFTVFTVVNYAKYQDKRHTDRQTTDKPPTHDRQTTDNNGTKINKDKQSNKATNIRAREKNSSPEAAPVGGSGAVIIGAKINQGGDF